MAKDDDAVAIYDQFRREMDMFNPELLDNLADLPQAELTKFITETYGDSPDGKLLHLCALRTKAARSPADFGEVASGGVFERPAHVELMNDVFVRSCYEPLRVIISISVRSGKSFYSSEWAPAWFLAKFPEKNVIQLSHSKTLSSNFASKARNILQESAPVLFGRRLSSSSRSKIEFGMAGHRGGVFAAGVDGGLIGRGGHYFAVDDLYKDASQAYSPAYNRELRDWWKGTVISRQEPGASIFVVLARWAETDFAGWLLEESRANPGSDKWVEIKIPQVAEENDPLGREVGDVLWAKRFPHEAIEKIRLSVGPITWASQYQQNPKALSNTMFPLKSWEYIPAHTYDGKITHVIRFWDLSSGGKYSDYVVGVLMGIDRNRRIIVLDVARERFTADGAEHEIHQFVKETIAEDRSKYPFCKFFFEETPGAGKEVASFYKREIFAGYNVESIKRSSLGGDKKANAIPFASAVQSSLVYLPMKRVLSADGTMSDDVDGDQSNYRVLSWVQDFIEELYVFPGGKNDDQVDAAAGAFSQLQELTSFGNLSELTIIGPDAVRDDSHAFKSVRSQGIESAALLEKSILMRTLGMKPKKQSKVGRIYRPDRVLPANNAYSRRIEGNDGA
jgi:hypothetical protein